MGDDADADSGGRDSTAHNAGTINPTGHITFKLPSAPDPSQDPAIHLPTTASTPEEEDNKRSADADDPDALRRKYKLRADTALKMLCTNIETLMAFSMQREVEESKSPFEGGMSPIAIRSPGFGPVETANIPPLPGLSSAITTSNHIHIAEQPPPPPPPPPPPNQDHKTLSEANTPIPSLPPDLAQHKALARKFISKKPPPISVPDYIARIHKYCPMSPGVFLAASHYLRTLILSSSSVVSLNTRSVHRLVLSALRIATKALEDGCHSHKHFARVSGISDVELRRLEIALCFLMGWEVQVRLAEMQEEARFAGYLLRFWRDVGKGDCDVDDDGEKDGIGGLKTSASTTSLLGEKRKASAALERDHDGQ